MTGVRVTGIQTALGAVRACIGEWRAQLGPDEYVVLVDLVARYVDAERRRVGRSHAGRRLFADDDPAYEPESGS